MFTLGLEMMSLAHTHTLFFDAAGFRRAV